MTDGKKRSAMIAVIAICVLVAGIVYWFTYGSTPAPSNADDLANTSVLMKCNNPKCKALYEITGKEYHEFMQQANPMGEGLMGMQCKQCGKASAFKAVKCEKCGSVFFYGAKGADFGDRCPKCRYSKQEQDKK